MNFQTILERALTVNERNGYIDHRINSFLEYLLAFKYLKNTLKNLFILVIRNLFLKY